MNLLSKVWRQINGFGWSLPRFAAARAAEVGRSELRGAGRVWKLLAADVPSPPEEAPAVFRTARSAFADCARHSTAPNRKSTAAVLIVLVQEISAAAELHNHGQRVTTHGICRPWRTIVGTSLAPSGSPTSKRDITPRTQRCMNFAPSVLPWLTPALALCSPVMELGKHFRLCISKLQKEKGFSQATPGFIS